MELVHGVPITQYCDQNQLDISARLELFIHVCNAVQHAHHKGIIHRDIKPSNVMVTLHDDQAVPKVIDFGIAKATQQRLTEKTVFTEFHQFLGTPAYMSPEQATMSGLDIDTRSDIYALGVLLYELLTGTTPYDEKRLREMPHDELCRVIREERPPTPSSRVRTLGNQLALICRSRSTAPGLLRRMLRGDVDWIVMKALEKDRSRRYETANGMAMDIHHHLNHEPVLAGPPSTAYRLRKYVKRNQVAVISAAVVVLALLLGTVATTVGFVQARLERNNAVSAQ
jgi:serine/threonine protein kinase